MGNQRSGLVRGDELPHHALRSFVEYHKQEFHHPRGINDILWRMNCLASRLQEIGHDTEDMLPGAMFRLKDDALDGTAVLRRVKARLNVFNDQLLDELVADGMREWHRARKPSAEDPWICPGDCGELHAALHKKKLEHQRLQENLRYHKVLNLDFRDVMKQQGEAYQKLRHELDVEKRQAVEKVAVLEEMLQQVKIAAASIQTSVSTITDASASGTSQVSRAYHVELDTRMARRLKERFSITSSTPETSSDGATHHRDSSGVASPSLSSAEIPLKVQQAKTTAQRPLDIGRQAG